jgi:shikimate dehydrogenase
LLSQRRRRRLKLNRRCRFPIELAVSPEQFNVSSPLQEIVCCMGQPVAGNPTQYIMEKAFGAAGLDWRYLTLEVDPERLADAVRGLRAMGFRGGNFTIPHKIAVIPLLDELSSAAEMMGAVNCVNHVGGRLIGENTDGKGFVESLRTVTDPVGKQIVVLGAGGAARAIAVELALAGAAEIAVANRTPERGQELVDLLTQKSAVAAKRLDWTGDFVVPAETHVLINATSVGLNTPDARLSLAVDSLRPELIVADVVFNPPQTRLLRDAAARGCTTLDGLGMLVNQAAIGFEIWTGTRPDVAVMREAIEEFFAL